MARWQVVSADGRHVGDPEHEVVVATYDTRKAARMHAERQNKAAKAAEGDSWAMWGEFYWSRDGTAAADERDIGGEVGSDGRQSLPPVLLRFAQAHPAFLSGQTLPPFERGASTFYWADLHPGWCTRRHGCEKGVHATSPREFVRRLRMLRPCAECPFRNVRGGPACEHRD